MRRLWLLAAASLLVDAYLLQDDETSNARTRLALTRAIVEEGRLTIDSYHADVLDKAYFQGHYYCDKAPLLSFVAVPAHAALHAAGVRAPRAIAYVTRLCTVSLATAAALPLFGLYLRRRGLSERAVVWTCAAGWFGTALMPYGTVFFGHNLTFALVAAAIALLPGRPYLAGLAAGLAVTSDYQAVGLAGLLGCRSLIRRDAREAGGLAAGAAAPLVLLLAYHQAIFGNPFTLPVRYEVDAAVHNMDADYDDGFYGVSLPKARALYLNLLSPGKGLLTLSPFLVLVVLALRRPTHAVLRRDTDLAWSSVAAYVAFITTIPSYHGGFSFGPRLLIPVLPFVLLLLAVALDRASRPLLLVAAAAGMLSAAIYLGATVTLVAVPYSFEAPVTQIVLPWLFAGHTAHNAGRLLGLTGTIALVPLVAALTALLGAALQGTGGLSPASGAASELPGS